ncbi:hypothetical protein LWI29_032428 [Acer saccharum]|uniref:Uncharacterized protein n=1 Tax=Acer saccharum TaxID=4024 RepID=A0AA39VPB0_ACESA|nr:hypothetical protein LWI29_032428 [Acer saccharum]
MVLVTHQLQGSYVTFPSRSLSLSRGLTLRRHVTTVHVVGKKRGSPNVFGVRVKPVKISAFKGSAQNNESGGRASGSKISKNSIKLSYIPKERSPAIHQLFKKWLTMLRTQSPSQVVREDLGEKLPAREEIPLLIFVPMYLAVNVIYGTGVSKELTPLWVFGPLIVALYVKMFQWLYALYVFSFKQTVKVVTNLPTYYLLAYNYIAQGKLIDEVGACVWQPVADIKNLGFKELSRRKLKEFQEWIGEQYLDFVESIWPYYCRTIRFLKRANLI